MGRRKKQKSDAFDLTLLELENISLSAGETVYPIINKEETGKCLRDLMKQKGFSIKDVQKYLGLSCVQSIYHWLDGRTLPNVDNLYALSQLLQVSMDSLVKGNKKIPENGLTKAFYRRMKMYCRVVCC